MFCFVLWLWLLEVNSSKLLIKSIILHKRPQRTPLNFPSRAQFCCRFAIWRVPTPLHLLTFPRPTHVSDSSQLFFFSHAHASHYELLLPSLLLFTCHISPRVVVIPESRQLTSPNVSDLILYVTIHLGRVYAQLDTSDLLIIKK